jgi:hypothetical protein
VKLAGNAVTPPVMTWITGRLLQALEAAPPPQPGRTRRARHRVRDLGTDHMTAGARPTTMRRRYLGVLVAVLLLIGPAAGLVLLAEPGTTTEEPTPAGAWSTAMTTTQGRSGPTISRAPPPPTRGRRPRSGHPP